MVAADAAAVLEPELDSSDPSLIALVRAGDTDAYGLLYARHLGSAQRLARVLSSNPSDVDDLVAEAFAKVLGTLRAGGGPGTAFRAYLLTTLRHVRYDRSRRERRIELTDDIARYETVEPMDDPTISRLEGSYAARAFNRLPERWRAVLWHTEVEGESPAQVAPLLGLTPNGVAALAYRARERLRQMYLQEHISLTSAPRCHWTGEHLAGYVRASLARRERGKVEDHLAECAECRRLHRELSEENAGFRGVLAAVLLGAAGPGYLASAGTFAFASWLAGLGGTAGAGWASLIDWLGTAAGWLAKLPTNIIFRYGAPNIAAAGGVVLAATMGVAVFAVVLMQGGSDQRIEVALGSPRWVSAGLLLWDGDRELTGDSLRLAGVPAGDPDNLASGQNPSAAALICPDLHGCAWRTPGMDLLQFAAEPAGRGALILRSGADPPVIGLIGVLTSAR